MSHRYIHGLSAMIPHRHFCDLQNCNIWYGFLPPPAIKITARPAPSPGSEAQGAGMNAALSGRWHGFYCASPGKRQAWDSGKHGFACEGDRGKHRIFPCVGEWTFYKERVSAMMSGDQQKVRPTRRTRCKGNETCQSMNVPNCSADSWSQKLHRFC